MSFHTIRGFVGHLVAATLIIAAFTIQGAAAQTTLTQTQRIESGFERAKQWCAHCHLVGPGAGAVAQIDVPSFESIAARPHQSLENIENRILNPHPPMPDLQLSREVLRELALYIMSLKR